VRCALCAVRCARCVLRMLCTVFCALHVVCCALTCVARFVIRVVCSFSCRSARRTRASTARVWTALTGGHASAQPASRAPAVRRPSMYGTAAHAQHSVFACNFLRSARSVLFVVLPPLPIADRPFACCFVCAAPVLLCRSARASPVATAARVWTVSIRTGASAAPAFRA
jgi:hypothetical protein